MAHQVSVREVATAAAPAASVDSALPVFVGVAPCNLGDESAVNKPILCESLADFAASFGSVFTASLWPDWTLLEVAYAAFNLFRKGPIVVINVIDPSNANHIGTGTDETHLIGADGTVTLAIYGESGKFGIIASTVVVKLGLTTMTEDTDYTLEFTTAGLLKLTVVDGGGLSAGDTIDVTFDYLDPSGVAAADIVGGYSGGVYTGLAAVDQVIPRLGKIPAQLVAPKWSKTASVGVAMQSAAEGMAGGFRAMAILDLPTDTAVIATYADAFAWKTTNSYTSPQAINCWPAVQLDTSEFNASTIVACVIMATDDANGGVPFVSPSNHAAKVNGATNDDGDEILLTQPQASSLGEQGIVTFYAGFDGWVAWNNRTGAYPASTDPKDAFIPIRRMFTWIGNTVIRTAQPRLSAPLNRRFVEGIVETVQTWLNSLVAVGALVAATIEFREDENSTTDLANGEATFHITITPPSPAQDIEFVLEYDANALSALFG